MDKVKILEIKCKNTRCGNWFKSPIFFGDLDSFDSSTLIGNKSQCPFCGVMTDCNKENMRIRATNGGFSGNETL